MKYKMIVTDFDDTLARTDLSYSQELMSSIKKYTEKGGKFVIATGRMTESIMPFCKKMGLKGELIAYQGAVIVDIDSEIEYERSVINYKDAYDISLFIESKGYYFHICKDNNVLIVEPNKYSELYRNYAKIEPVSLYSSLSEYVKENKFSPLKIMILTEPEMVNDIIEEMRGAFGDKILINTSKKWVVEMISKDASKGIAVSKLADKYGIKREEVICIGDAENDISMIVYAGLGIVVENGSEKAKAHADLIAPSNDNDGVAYIIKKYGLEE